MAVRCGGPEGSGLRLASRASTSARQSRCMSILLPWATTDPTVGVKLSLGRRKAPAGVRIAA